MSTEQYREMLVMLGNESGDDFIGHFQKVNEADMELEKQRQRENKK